MATDRKGRLQEFVDWAAAHITGDIKLQSPRPIWERDKVRAHDRLFQAFGQKGLLDVGGTAEFRIRKAKEHGGGTALADYVWKPHVLIEMKKRGTDLRRTYRQAFDYWTRLVPGLRVRSRNISPNRIARLPPRPYDIRLCTISCHRPVRFSA